MKNYYTEKEYKLLLQNLVVLCATNEQKNAHILQYFDKKGIKYKNRALKTGDYSFKIQACEELHIYKDIYYTDELCIERKNGVSELAGNIGSKSELFRHEIWRMAKIDNSFLIVENDSLDDIKLHNYISQYNEKAFYRTILTFLVRYGINILFTDKDNMGYLIYELCVSVLNNNILK